MKGAICAGLATLLLVSCGREPAEERAVLQIAPDFSLSLLAGEAPGAWAIAQDRLGNFWISRTSEGIVSLFEVSKGEVTHQSPIFEGLNRPSGIAIDPRDGMVLYVAEEHRIARVHLYTEDRLTTVVELPGGGARALAFGPDDRLYVSIEAIYSLNRDGSDFRPHEPGLRNAGFFTWSYVDGRMWVIEDGRLIGPEGVAPIGLPQGWSPLGLAFVPEEGWPEDYWYDLLVAVRGGVVRVRLDEAGNYQGLADFITGAGRPAGMIVQPGGIMYLTDEGAGAVYRIGFLAR